MADDITNHAFDTLIYEFSKNTSEMGKMSLITSTRPAIPSLSLGFQQHLHASTLQMNRTLEFNDKKKAYTTMMPFYKNIFNNEDSDLNEASKKYFNLKDMEFDDEFYEIWEILFTFGILKNTSKCTTLQANDPHKLAIKLFDKMYLDGKISIVEEKGAAADLILSCRKTEWIYDILNEQKSTDNIINHVIFALNNLSKNGDFIMELFETFTNIMCKLIYVLTTVFDKVYIHKPLTSHECTPKKYVICRKYASNADTLSQLNKLNYKNIHNLDIFSNVIYPEKFVSLFIQMNRELSTRQIIHVNQIVKFIKSRNYYGEDFDEGQKKQLAAANFWINVYYPKTKKLKDIKFKTNNKDIPYAC